MATRMQQRRGTAAQWANANPILNVGEIGYETDFNRFKIGDGENHWEDLPYFLDEDSIGTQLGDYVEVSKLGAANGVATLNSSGKLESSQVPNIDELAQDAVDSALVAGSGITKTYNDGANTITIAVDTSVIATKAELAEVAQDSINDALIAGAGLNKTYDDSANTLTIDIDSTVATLSGVQTLTNKTINLANNVITGTIDEFNQALSGENFATQTELLAEVEYHSDLTTGVHGVGGNVVGTSDSQTLTNKTINLANNTLSGTLAEFNASISDDNILPVSGGTMTGALTLSGAPTQDLHAATKSYVDGVSQGLHIHASAKAATATNVNISTDLEPGDIVDGVTLSEGDRVLVKSQTNAAQNGIYVVQASGAALRASDFNEPIEVDGGDFIFVDGGSLYGDTGWVQVTDNVVTIGTDPIVFTQFSGAGTFTAGTGLVLSGSQFAIANTVVTTSDTQTLSSKSISLATNTLTGNISQFNAALSDANFATIDGSETLTNKTISAANNTITIASANVSDFNAATSNRLEYAVIASDGISKVFDGVNGTVTLSVDGSVVKVSDGQTLTNKTINLANNTVTGTLAEFNAALSDADFASSADVSNSIGQHASSVTSVHGVGGNVVGTSDTQTLTNKTINLANNTITTTLAQLNAAVSDANLVSTDDLSDGNFATIDGSETLTNKTIDLTDNTLTGTFAEFNAAVSDANLVSSTDLSNSISNAITDHTELVTGVHGVNGNVVGTSDAQTLTGKTISLANNIISGTVDEFNTALSDGNFATQAGTETLTNKTIHSANNTITITSANVSDFVEASVDAAANALSIGAHTNITVTYDDSAGSISLAAAPGYSDEQAQDAVGNNVGIGLVYDDSAGSIYVNTNTIQARVSGVSDTEIGYLDGVTSSIQTQINSKQDILIPSAEFNIANNVIMLNPSAVTVTDFADPVENFSLAGYKITNLGTPTDSTDAVTKAYVDAVTEGLHIHASAKAATTANINLSTDLENGDVLDGVTLATGDRVLVKNQTTASQNGIYVVQASGAAVRAADFDSPAEIDGGDFIFVSYGTVNSDTGWVQVNTVGTIGTDPISFTQFSGAGTYTAGTGLSLNGNQFTINNTVATLSDAQTLTNKTINGANNTLTVRIANDVSGLGSGVATFLATPSSANLASAVTDETGSGALVFGTSPTIVTPRVQMAMNAQTGTSYTPTLTDASNRLVTLDNASAITVTVPPSVYSTGDSVIFQQTNTGQVTFAQGSGVTITSAGATTAAPRIRTRFSSATLICTGSNTFTVIGDII